MGVDIMSRGRRRKVSVQKLKKTAQTILTLLDQHQRELSLALVDNREIQELNARYRNKNEPTDVLSFPSGGQFFEEEVILGDVVISVEKAEERARKGRKTVEQEIVTLLIHGILHLLGYDHERSQREAKIMRRLERKVSRALCQSRALRV